MERAAVSAVPFSSLTNAELLNRRADLLARVGYCAENVLITLGQEFDEHDMAYIRRLVTEAAELRAAYDARAHPAA